jgi:capsular exopolysaccharide synthesis family protein
MSGIHRAMEKAERDGVLSWTRSDERPARPAAVEPPRPARADGAVTVVDTPATWTIPDAVPEPDDPAERREFADPIGDPVSLSLSPLFVVATDPSSPAAEQYRLLRTRLESRDHAGRNQFLIVTSPRLGEGKTTTSANLALTMAQEFQHRVLLVEADLRRPTLAEQFALPPGPGLVDILIGTATLEEALVTVPGHPLVVLPAGAGAARSTELLASSGMQRLVEALRARFDRIVVDTPPMTLADTHVLAQLADGILMVVRSGITPKPAVERALAGLDRRRLLGIVLNEVNDERDGYAYPQYARDIAE